jgi:hypothetical protein
MASVFAEEFFHRIVSYKSLGDRLGPTPATTMSSDKENRMTTFAEDATLNTYTCDSDDFKKVENVGGSLSTIIWD